MQLSKVFCFERAVARNIPFRHFVAPAFCDENVADLLLAFCERSAKWSLREEDDFYATYDLSLRTVDLPSELEILRSRELIDGLTEEMGEHFGAPLRSDKVDITLQRMVNGQRIGIHTDFGPVGQNYRLLLQLNRGWTAKNGGVLLFLDSDRSAEPSEQSRFYIPQHRLGVGFEISPQSFHAVSEVRAAERFTLCYSFYRLPKGVVGGTE